MRAGVRINYLKYFFKDNIGYRVNISFVNKMIEFENRVTDGVLIMEHTKQTRELGPLIGIYKRYYFNK